MRKPDCTQNTGATPMASVEVLPSQQERQAQQEEALMTIGALAEASGVTVRTLRYYEELDLITPSRRSQGRYRLYNGRALHRIHAILALQELNYSLEEIQGLLGPASTLAQNQSKPQRYGVSREALGKQLECVDSKLAKLQALRDTLQDRLRELEQHCLPCSSQQPVPDCHDSCAHRGLHID